MDQSLSSPAYSPLRRATGTETSRCARCVKDKKGCDRGFPCGRCVESGVPNLCVYTGALPKGRRKSGMRQSTRMSLTHLNSEAAMVSSDIDNDAILDLTPAGSARRKKRKRSSVMTHYKHRSSQGGQQYPIDDPSVSEDWFQQPPAREETEPLMEEQEKTDEEIARAKIYGSYTDIVVHLPVEIYRSTTFIRSLDYSYKMKSRELDDLCRQLKSEVEISAAVQLRQRIIKLMRESREDRAEALAEVSKLQTLIEGHISVLGLEVDKIENPQSTLPPMIEDSTSSRKSKKGTKKHGQDLNQDKSDIPMDDDEPVYCYCQRVSFGKMIACENEQCEGGEWFHFDCLGWTSAPRGKWWCETCTANGLAGKTFLSKTEESDKRSHVRGETNAEKRLRIREENRRKEILRREKLKKRRQSLR